MLNIELLARNLVFVVEWHFFCAVRIGPDFWLWSFCVFWILGSCGFLLRGFCDFCDLGFSVSWLLFLLASWLFAFRGFLALLIAQ